MKSPKFKAALIFVFSIGLVGCIGASSSLAVTPSPGMEWLVQPLSEEQAQLTLRPDVAGPGDLITIEGQRFPPDTPIAIYLAPASSGMPRGKYQSVNSGQDGTFETTFYLPDTWPSGEPISEQDLVVAATTSDFRAAAFAFLTFRFEESLLSTLTLDLDQGAPGTIVTVTGSGFTPGTTVNLRLGVPQTGLNDESLGTVVVDAEGHFLGAVAIPAVWPGTSDAVVEQDLIIGAVNEDDLILATASFSNMAGQRVNER